MKELRILKSSNGWEYTDLVVFKYKDNYELKRTEKSDFYYDDKEQFDTVIVDGVEVIFDDRCELEKKYKP